MTRLYSSISQETALASEISATATSMTVTAGTGSALLGGVTLAAGNVDQFTVALDPDTANEEIVFITANSSDTFTITRARAGTSGVIHAAGASVKHVLTSDDLNAFKASISPVTNVGFAGSTSGTTTVQASAVAGTTTLTLPAATDTLVGRATTDTLTNKTLTSPTINGATIGTSVTNISFTADATTAYTPILTDASKLITLSNTSAITFSIPTNASVAFPVGTVLNVQQINTGQVTIQAASSGTTTVTSSGNTTAAPKLRTRYSAASCIKTGTDTWTVVGDIA